MITSIVNKHIASNQLGYYKVNGNIFLNKHQALVESSNTKHPATYHWFDDEFKKFDRSLLGKRPLTQMYKERAQQLRDNYDYLILNYSGGCDSYNILRTFLDNDIKLDQIMVCWPFKASEIYKANNKDTSAKNFMSEWEFATKLDLEWISKNYPEIKIELIDWVDPFIKNPTLVSETAFDNLNHFHNLADLTRSTLFSKDEERLINRGKKVATIWGIDKPNITLDNGVISMSFNDRTITVGHPAPCNPHGTEYFYWTPTMPEIAFEMAYQTALWFKARPGFHRYLRSRFINLNLTHLEYQTLIQINHVAARDSCYATWNNKFQVNKPLSNIRDDKDFWLYQHPELKHHVDRWKPLYTELLSVIDDNNASFSYGPQKKVKDGYDVKISMYHEVCNFNTLQNF